MSSRPQIKKIIHLPKMAIGRQVKQLVKTTGKGSAALGIKIGGPKAGIATPAISKQQEEDNLRAQLHAEIEWRSRACAHRAYECHLPVAGAREYCARHVLGDASAPYRQCSFSSAPGRRCPLPAPLAPPGEQARRDQGLCFEHAYTALTSRQKAACSAPPQQTTETLLHNLQHYVKCERPRTASSASTVSVVSEPADPELPGGPHALDPFKQVDANTVNASISASILECVSESGSECESVTLAPEGQCRGGFDEDSSGAEDVSYDRHPLRYAGIYTAEEVVGEARSALRLLQAGYLRQLTRLRRLLRLHRARYLRSLARQRETYCSINEQSKQGMAAKERKQLAKLKAYAGFHRKSGVDAILARKLHDKRAKVCDGVERLRPPPGRCSFMEGGVKCSTPALPQARHCHRHILHDTQQVLFQACGDTRAGVNCQEPVPAIPATAGTCLYHTDPPQYTIFTLKKEDSDSDEEMEGEEMDRVLEEGLEPYSSAQSDALSAHGD